MDLIEHPHFNNNMIPEGWERITVGLAYPGDKILRADENNHSFLPWTSRDGENILTQSWGTTSTTKLYKCVLIRNKNTNAQAQVQVRQARRLITTIDLKCVEVQCSHNVTPHDLVELNIIIKLLEQAAMRLPHKTNVDPLC